MRLDTLALESPAEVTVSAPMRLYSLDLFRGLTIAGMIVVNNQSGLEEEEIVLRIKEDLLPGVEDLEVEIDERESSYYLNLSRDRHFQAFIRRFGGERKQQA